MSKLYVVNANGEVLDEIEGKNRYVKLSEGDKVLRKNALNYLTDSISIKYSFIKVNPVAYSRIATKCPIVNKLILYLSYMDNILTYKNGRIIKLKDIHKVCDVSESTAKRQMKILFDEDVIHKVKDGEEKCTYLVFNPWVAYIGKRIYLSLYNEFKYSSWKEECDLGNG